MWLVFIFSFYFFFLSLSRLDAIRLHIDRVTCYIFVRITGHEPTIILGLNVQQRECRMRIPNLSENQIENRARGYQDCGLGILFELIEKRWVLLVFVCVCVCVCTCIDSICYHTEYVCVLHGPNISLFILFSFSLFFFYYYFSIKLK